MENCEKFKELILTDYSDGEVDPASKAQIDSHLVMCPDCRSFAREVEESLMTPLKEARKEQVPDRVWLSIKGQIENEGTSNVETESFVDRLVRSLTFPRLAPAFGILCLLLLLGSAVFHNRQIQQAKEKEQVEYLAYLIEPEESFSEAPTLEAAADEPATFIEEYFL